MARLNTEVIVRGIVVPGYSYVNLDQSQFAGSEKGGREKGGSRAKRNIPPPPSSHKRLRIFARGNYFVPPLPPNPLAEEKAGFPPGSFPACYFALLLVISAIVLSPSRFRESDTKPDQALSLSPSLSRIARTPERESLFSRFSDTLYNARTGLLRRYYQSADLILASGFRCPVFCRFTLRAIPDFPYLSHGEELNRKSSTLCFRQRGLLPSFYPHLHLPYSQLTIKKKCYLNVLLSFSRNNSLRQPRNLFRKDVRARIRN